VELDVTSDESVTAAVASVSANVDHLDALVNNAGITGGGPAPLETGPADFLACYGVNLLGPVRVTRSFPPPATALGAASCRDGLERHGLARGDNRP
jgi:NAD(P)-dependent dehydrogenase (short-subunit alcohol dehydrogenase family)